jgi:catechol O-methyltransferase
MLLLHVERVAETGNPESVLSAVDDFCYSRHWMMHVGDIKGQIVDDAVLLAARGLITSTHKTSNSAECAVEIGSYCGYSAVRIARLLPSHVLMYSIETEPQCRAWTKRMLTKAGLLHKVEIIPEISQMLQIISMETDKKSVVFLFIDHAKEKYLEDLKLFEKSNCMKSPGCVVVADNIYSFGVPLQDYINHVDILSGLYDPSSIHKRNIEYSTTEELVSSSTNEFEDGIAVSVYK